MVIVLSSGLGAVGKMIDWCVRSYYSEKEAKIFIKHLVETTTIVEKTGPVKKEVPIKSTYVLYLERIKRHAIGNKEIVVIIRDEENAISTGDEEKEYVVAIGSNS